MIPQDYYFMVNEGNGENAPHVAIPARSNAMYVFESREDVDTFIKRTKFFRDLAFGKSTV